MPVTDQRRQKIIVLGMGHVGGATAAWLLRDGHEVVAVDPDARRLERLSSGSTAPPYARVAPVLAAGRREGRLDLAAELTAELLDSAQTVLVCVGTPAGEAGTIDIAQVMDASRAIATASRRRSSGAPGLTVVYRSTLPVGTIDRELLPLLRNAAVELEVAMLPEFLREAHALEDALTPTRIVLGERFQGATARLGGLLRSLAAPVLEVSFATAELAKLVDNAWHALKVTFANEVGRLAIALEVDPRPIEDILLADRRLNISPAYLRYGLPFGGSCLPKDVAALVATGASSGASIPALASILPSNRLQQEHVLERVRRLVPPPARILLLGLVPPGGAGKIQESSLFGLARRLLDQGYELRLVDPDVALEALDGADRDLARAYLVVPQVPEDEGYWQAVYRPDLVLDGKGGMMELPGLPPSIPTLRLAHSRYRG